MNTQRIKILLFLTSLTPLLLACVQTPLSETNIPAAKREMGAIGEPPVKSPSVEVGPSRAFPEDSIYPLLVAEFALRRGQFELALDNYLGQSKILRDTGVSTHTTHLAQFLKNDKAALKSALLWVELDPENIEANFTLANLLGRHQKPLEAMPYMSAVLRGGGEVNFAALAVTSIKLGEDTRNEMQEKIKILLVEFPNKVELKLALAVLLEEQKNYELALEQVKEIFSREPQQLQAVVLEARILQQIGDRKNTFTRLLKVLKQQPGNNRLRLQYARLLVHNDLNAAKQQFALLIENTPNDPDLLYSYALINQELGEHNTATAYFERLLSFKKHDSAAHYYLGKVAEANKNIDKALEHYSEVKFSADFVTANNRAAAIWFASGSTYKFTEHFHQLRLHYPDSHEKLYILEAKILLQQELPMDSHVVLTRGIDEFPASNSLRYARSLVSEKLLNIDLMEKDLRAIIKQEPKNTTALNALGYGLTVHTTRYQEALKLIQRALEINPEEAAILDSMGWVQYQLGQHQQALTNLQRAYKSFPEPEVAAHLGEVLWALGHTQEAQSLWKKSLRDNPENLLLLNVIRRFTEDVE